MSVLGDADDQQAADHHDKQSERLREIQAGWIYALIDPRDHCIFYVGQTRDIETRKRMHFAGGHSVSGEKIKILRRNGLLPLVVILQADVPADRLMAAEEFWIGLLRLRGSVLLNVPTDGEARRRLWDDARREGFGAPRVQAEELDFLNDRRRVPMIAREQRRQQRVRDLGQPVNAGKTWTRHEALAVCALFRRGLRAGDIARRVGRSRDAVASRLVRLGLVDERG